MTDLFWNIVETMNVMLEFGIVYIFHTRLFEHKYENRIFDIIGYTLGAVFMLFLGMITNNSTILISATFIIITVLSFVLYNGTLTRKLFCSACFIVFVILSEMLFIGVMSALDFGTPAEIVGRGLGRIIGIIGTKVIYFWMIYILCGLINSKTKPIPVNHWVMIILTPVLSTAILCTLFQNMITITDSFNAAYLVSVIGILYLNYAVFDFFETYNKQIRLSLLEQIVEIEDENYRLIEMSYGEMRKLKHDISNQISVIRRLLENNDKNSAENVIDAISKSLTDAGSVCYTGEPIIDSIINIKIQEAHQHGIKVSVRINTKKIETDRFELCRILGNALDNAIEGSLRNQNVNRHIYISLQRIKNKIAIEITNNSDYVDTNNMLTSKSNKTAHRLGMESIRTSVEKMNGVMYCSCENGIYSLKIVVSEQK